LTVVPADTRLSVPRLFIDWARQRKR
jgi:hypothetical protein